MAAEAPKQNFLQRIMKKEPKPVEKVSESGDDMKLKAKLGLVNGCTVIIGCIIGSGIFLTPSGVLKGSGSVGVSLIMWFVCGIISLIGSFCYAELGMTITRSGADYAYIMEAFGKFAAFMRMWVEVVLIRPCLIAIVSLTFAKYVLKPFFECETDNLQPAEKLLAGFCIMVLTFVNVSSIRATTLIQDVFTYAKVGALLIIIITGIVNLANGKTEYFQNPWEVITAEPISAKSISTAVYEGLFAYNGWNFLNYVIEELKTPEKNLLRAIIISLSLCITVYMFAIVAYMTVISPEEILHERAVALVFAKRCFGPAWWLMPIAVSLSCFGTVNGILFTSSRLMFVGARYGHLPEAINLVQLKAKTPVMAVLFTGLASIGYVCLPMQIGELIGFSSFVFWLAIGCSVLALIVLRYTHPELERPLKLSLFWPILYVCVTVVITVVPIIEKPLEAFYGTMFVLSGVPIYLIFIVWYPKFMETFSLKITVFFQKFFLSVPEKKTV